MDGPIVSIVDGICRFWRSKSSFSGSGFAERNLVIGVKFTSSDLRILSEKKYPLKLVIAFIKARPSRFLP